MERLLEDAEKLTGVEYDIDSLADVYEAIHAIQQEMDITGTTALESAETFSGSLASMKASYRDLMGQMALGNDIKPALRNLLETVKVFFVGNFLPMVGNILKGLLDLVVEMFQSIGPEFMQSGITMLSELSSGVISGIPTFISSLGGIITSYMAWATENLPTFLSTGVDMLTNMANGILESIPTIVTVAGEIITSFISYITENLPLILEAGKNLLLNLLDGIINNLPEIGNTILTVVSNIIDSLVANAPTLVIAGYGILTSLIAGILEKLPELTETALTLITDFIQMIIGKIPDIIQAGRDILTNFLAGLAEIIPNILSTIGTLGSDIISSVSSINLWEAGKAIMNSLLSGLKEAWGGVTNFVGGIGSWIQENKGPIEYDRKLLIPAGKAIMGGLHSSLEEGFKDTQKFVSGIAGAISSKVSEALAPMAGMDDTPNLNTNKVKTALDNQMIKFYGQDLANTNNSEDNQRMIELLELLAMKNPNLVTDDGTVLGYYSTRFDREFGIMTKNSSERRLK